jgi:hypothetical protein
MDVTIGTLAVRVGHVDQRVPARRWAEALGPHLAAELGAGSGDGRVTIRRVAVDCSSPTGLLPAGAGAVARQVAGRLASLIGEDRA